MNSPLSQRTGKCQRVVRGMCRRRVQHPHWMHRVTQQDGFRPKVVCPARAARTTTSSRISVEPSLNFDHPGNPQSAAHPPTTTTATAPQTRTTTSAAPSAPHISAPTMKTPNPTPAAATTPSTRTRRWRISPPLTRFRKCNISQSTHPR